MSLGFAPLNNITAPDAYDDAAQIICPGAVRFNLTVANQAIYYQLGDSSQSGGAITWRAELYQLPTFASLDQNADAIRVRAAILAADIPADQLQAQLTVVAYPQEAVN